MTETVPTLVVFGLDLEGRPRAARFAESDAALASKAAALLGYRSLRVGDGEILNALPEGDVLVRGNQFIRRVRRSLFDKLAAPAGEGQDTDAGAAPKKARPGNDG